MEGNALIITHARLPTHVHAQRKGLLQLMLALLDKSESVPLLSAICALLSQWIDPAAARSPLQVGVRAEGRPVCVYSPFSP